MRIPTLALSLVLAAAACNDTSRAPLDGGDGETASCGLSLSPVLGAVADHSIKVWIRAAGSSSSSNAFRVRYWPKGQTTAALDSEAVTLAAAHDYTGVATLTGLAAQTDYEYTILLRGSDATACPTLTFHTLPEAASPSHVRFTIGADVDSTNIPGFEEMRQVHPDFVLMVGDQVYEDSSTDTLDAYRGLYREIWSGAQFRSLFEHVPAFMIWDDHETANDAYPGKYSDRDAFARQAFDEYQGGHNPAPLVPGKIYFTFSAGGADFFVFDLRSYRSANAAPDSPDKTMLGAEQKAALKHWLTTSQAKVKVLISSVPMDDFGTTGQDSWFGFQHERAEIMDFIHTQNVGCVFVITGDQHWSAVFRTPYGMTDPYVIYEFMPTPIGIANRVAPSTVSDQILARDDDQRVFGVIDIDTKTSDTTVDYTLCQVGKACHPQEEPPPSSSQDVNPPADNLPYSLHLHATDHGLAP